MASTSSHDSGYKQLFSHPQMVRDLLLGFVPGLWLKNARFDTLERINASYVSGRQPVLRPQPARPGQVVDFHLEVTH